VRYGNRGQITERNISYLLISSYGQFKRYLKIIYLGFEKSQRSVTHDSLCYINILTYLLTYLLRTREHRFRIGNLGAENSH